MGLFSKKTDEQIIAEGRTLYIKGDLSGASLKLMKIAHKGNPEACYLIAKIHLEIADKRERELYTKSAKGFLEKAVAAGHKGAAVLMEQKFGVPNPYAEDCAKKEAAVKAEAEARGKAEAEEQARKEAERVRAQEVAKEEAKRKAEAEELKRLKEEKAKAEAAIAELEKPAPDSTEKVLEDIHELENKIEDAFAEKLAELEAMESAAEEKTDEPEEERMEEAESVEEASGDDEDDIAIKNIEDALALYENGKVDEAIAVWREYAEKGNLLAEYYLAMALGEKEEYDEALAWAKVMQNNCPNEETRQVADELIERINICIQREKEARKENEFKSIQEITEKGRIADKEGRIDEAIELFFKPAEKGYVPAMYYLARSLGKKGKYQEALKWTEEIPQELLNEEQQKMVEELVEKLKERKERVAEKLFEKGMDLYLAQSYEGAIGYFMEAAEQGCADAQYNLAFMYYMGVGTEQDLEEAFKWYKVAAEQGYVKAQFNLAIMCNEGIGTKQNLEEAFKWYKAAAEQEYVEAQSILGAMCYEGLGTEKNLEEAFKWFKTAAEQGKVEAQFNLAGMYYYGNGTAENLEEAFKWYKEAAGQGFEKAQFHLAEMYYYGKGILEDKQEALKWYKAAAKQGSIVVTDELSWRGRDLYLSGKYVEAIGYYQAAAEQGDVDAQFHLAVMYYKGEGIPEDKQEALKWFKAAAEQGDVDAQYELAKLYLRGNVVEIDRQESRKWVEKALESKQLSEENVSTAKKILEISRVIDESPNHLNISEDVLKSMDIIEYGRQYLHPLLKYYNFLTREERERLAQAPIFLWGELITAYSNVRVKDCLERAESCDDVEEAKKWHEKSEEVIKEVNSLLELGKAYKEIKDRGI